MKEDIFKLMHEQEIDWIIVSGSHNSNPTIHYLAPTIHLFDYLIILRKEGNPVIFYNDMDRDEAKKTGFELMNYLELYQFDYNPHQRSKYEQLLSFYHALFRALEIKGRVMLHIFNDVSFYHNFLTQLQNSVPEIQFLFEDTARLFKKARESKSDSEITALKKAGQKSCQVFQAVEAHLENLFDKDGLVVDGQGQPVTIGHIKRFINVESARRDLLVDIGAIFAQGRDAGVPHNSGNPEDVLRTGESIVFDFGPHDPSTGYKFDMTRSYCLNHAPDHLHRAYKSINEALHKVERQLLVGTPLGSYHNLVCDHFEQSGYPTLKSDQKSIKGFTHGLGHGIGIEVHEAPSLYLSNTNPLVPGMVFTVEPGLYFPDDGWGLRLEDVIAVHPDGRCENITPHRKKFILQLQQWAER